MTNQLFSGPFHFYQSANADAERIRENFLIRLHEFDIIMDDIRNNPMKGAVQHYLLLGRRGSGKSTLLKRLQIEIDTDEKLRRSHIAINLAEEQANIYKLFDLLEEILNELEHQDIEIHLPEWEEDNHVYARNLFSALHTAIEGSGKKLVLLLDNIDRIFENLSEEAALLREYLLNYDDIKIIGGSTKMTEHFWKYNQPFYQFFRVLELKPLTSIEIRKLLLNWSEKLDLLELKEFVEKKPGQLEMVRLLTDGLPRTLQFFVNILLTRTQETGYEYLRLIMDSVTPLYQERLNNLPPSHRKIVLQMAFIWEAAGAKEIGEATKMDNKLISAQLKQLIEKGIAEKIPTGTKNHLYRLSERFFNLWLIFTQGSPKDKRKAKCLTVFLENFYDAQELVNIASAHLQALEEGSLAPNKAALLTKAFAQSKYISYNLRNTLLEKTLALDGIANDLRLQLPSTTEKIWIEVKDLISKKDFKKAIKIAETVEQEDGIKDFMIGSIYYESKDFPVAEKYLLIALEKGIKDALFTLGSMCIFQENFPLAKKYFRLGLDNKIVGSGFGLASINYFTFNNKEECLSLIRQERELFSKDENADLNKLEIMVDAWCGNLDKIEAKFHALILKKQMDNFEILIEHLLYHYQANLVYQLFTGSEFSSLLQENYSPIYYATLLLANKDANAQLKIPPELEELVNNILDDIRTFQKFYYPDAQAEASVS